MYLPDNRDASSHAGDSANIQVVAAFGESEVPHGWHEASSKPELRLPGIKQKGRDDMLSNLSS